MLAMLAQSAPGYDPDSVTPGVIGFAATAIVAIAVCFLLFDMNRRVRRIKYREEARAQIAAEQAAAEDAPVEDAPVEGDAASADAAEASSAVATPEQGDQQR